MKEIKRVKLAAGIVLVAMTLFLLGCEQKSINQILADPQRYANREVGIKGNVVQSYSVLGRGAYQVDDGTGKLWIVSEKGVPRKGARVGVQGKIRDGFDLGGLVKLPEAVGSGLVMVESKHRAQD
ncbi:MAG: hypothetical protein AB1898_17110 [Acidobacteriota bacterium]